MLDENLPAFGDELEKPYENVNPSHNFKVGHILGQKIIIITMIRRIIFTN